MKRKGQSVKIKKEKKTCVFGSIISQNEAPLIPILNGLHTMTMFHFHWSSGIQLKSTKEKCHDDETKGEGVSEVARGKVGEGPSHTQEEDKKLNA